MFISLQNGVRPFDTCTTLLSLAPPAGTGAVQVSNLLATFGDCFPDEHRYKVSRNVPF
jgi:hypothetical protein